MFLNDDDYFFQRAKCLTDHFLDKATLRKIIKFVLGYEAAEQGYSKKFGKKSRSFKINGVNVESFDRSNQLLSYIKQDSIKTKLKIQK